MRTYFLTLRGFNRDIINYLIFNSAVSFAYLGTLNVLMNLYLLRLGYQTGFIGGLLASGMITWGVLALPAGTIGARIGLKRAMIAAMFTLSASALLLIGAGFLAEPYRAPSLVICWMLLWGGAALVSVNSLPYVMAITTAENRSYVFSVQQALAALVILTGSLISGVLPGLYARLLGTTLDRPLPYQLAMLLTPLFYLIAGLILFKARDIAPLVHSETGSVSQPAPLLIFFVFAIIVILQSASEGAARNFFNVYLDAGLKVPVSQIGAVLGMAQVLPVIGSLVIPLIMTRMGSRGTMLATTILSAGCIFLMAAIGADTAAALAFMGFTGMSSITGIARSIFSQEIVSQRWRTTTSALATIGIAGGWAISAWLGGSLIARIGYRGLFLGGAGLGLLAVLLTFIDGRMARGRRLPDDLALAPVPLLPGEPGQETDSALLVDP